MNKLLTGIIIVIATLALYFFGTYNSLISQTTAIDGQWAQVETQYQRRFDLIPNLVRATQGFLKQEQTIFNDLAKARQGYAGAKSGDEKVAAASNLESTLGRLLVIVENYPNLKSNETVSKLMDELAGTENRISVERKRYNDLVQSYDTSIKTIPTSFVAGIGGFKEKPYFKSVGGSETAPKVEL